MKIQLKKDIKTLGFWKKHPIGYAVIVLEKGVVLEGAATGYRIDLVRVPANVDAAFRKLERIRAEYDENPKGMKPKLVVVSGEVRADRRNVQFLRRAELIEEIG